MKKVLIFLCVMVMAFTLFSVPVFAEPGYMDSDVLNNGIMSTVDYAEAKYPTWETFNTMRDKLPTKYQHNSIYYDLNQHFIAIGKSLAYDDGTAKIWLYSSDKVSTQIKSMSTVMYSTKIDNDVAKDRLVFAYYWDYDTSEWVYTEYWSGTLSYRENGILWNNFDIYHRGSDTTIDYPSGISSVYLNQLENDGSLGYPGYDDGGEEEDKDYSGILGWLQKIWDKITEGFTAVKTAVESLGRSIGSFFSDLGNLIATKFTDLTTSIGDFFTTLWDNIVGFFVPNEGFMEETMSRMNDFCDQSDFLSAITYFVQELRDFTQQDFSEPPEIKVDLGAAEGKYDYGVGEFSVFNVSWFARYRTYTDPFISAFLWVVFIWALAKRLPELLNGAGMVADMPADIVESVELRREKEALRTEREESRAHRDSYEGYKERRSTREEYARRYREEKRGGK